MIGYEAFMASCPHFGAPVTDKVCPYCGSILGVFPEDKRCYQEKRVIRNGNRKHNSEAVPFVIIPDNNDHFRVTQQFLSKKAILQNS